MIKEEVKRLPPKPSVINELFALSGNVCALEEENLFSKEGYIGQICHIEAASVGGPRFNRNSNNEERRAKNNLLILCSNCHKRIDNKANIDKYPVEYLREIKALHENNYRNNKSELTPKQENYLLERFNDFKKELAVIQNHLGRVKIFKKFETLRAKFDPTTTLLENNLIYYTVKEESKNQNYLNRIIKNKQNQYLILGNPASGKTTLGFFLHFELSKHNIQSYYVDIDKIKDYTTLFDDIFILSDFSVMLFVDNIHLNIPLAIEIYQKAHEYPNITFIYSSRVIDKENQIDDTGLNIYEELKNTAYKIEYSEIEFKDKISGIVEKRKKQTQNENDIRKVGNLNSVYNTVNKNLLKLNLLLDLWCRNTVSLDNIDDNKLNTDLFARYLSKVQNSENIELFTSFAVLGSFEVGFQITDNQTDAISPFKTNGIIHSSGNYHFFAHPQFAALLVNVIISKSSDFRRKYIDINDFYFKTIKQYILSFRSFEFKRFPENLDIIFSNLRQNKVKEIFCKLVADIEVQQIVINFFIENTNYISGFSSFLKGLQNYMPSLIENYGKKIFTSVSESPDKLNIEHLKTITFILKKRSNSDIYKLFLSKYCNNKNIDSYSAINTLTYSLVYIYEFDPKLSRQLIRDLDINKLIKKFNSTSIALAGNSLLEVKKIDKIVANNVFAKIDLNSLRVNSKKLTLIQISKGLNELYQFDRKKLKELFLQFDFSYLKPILYNSDIDRISKAFNEFRKIDRNRSIQLFNNIDFSHYYSDLRQLNLSNLARVLSEIDKFSPEKSKQIISELHSNEDWQKEFTKAKNLNQIADIVKNTYRIFPAKIKELIAVTNFEDFFKTKLNKNSALYIAYFLQALSKTNPHKANNLYQQVDNELIISKLDKTNVFITQVLQVFDNLWQVNNEKTKNLYKQTDNYLFVKKAMVFEIKFYEITQVLSHLFKISNTKTKSIYKNLLNQNVFKKKAKQSGIIHFLSSYAKLVNIEPNDTKKQLKNILDYFCDNKPKFNNDISNLGIAIRKFSEYDKEESKRLLRAYSDDLANAANHSKLTQIASGLVNCSRIDKELAFEITQKIDFNVLIKKGMDTYTSDLSRSIPEICIANKVVGNSLKHELIKRKKLKYIKKK